MTSSPEPLMLAILDAKLRESKKPFLDIAAFMHKKYTEYLLTCLNGNTQVMDLVDGWCKMGVKYSLEMENCKNDIKNSKLVQVLSENADIKHQLDVLKKQIKARDDADYRRSFVEMSDRVENDDNQNMDENHENSEILEISDSPILKQEKDLLEDLLTNPSLNANDSMDLQINSGNNRNSSTEDILNRFSLDSELLDLTGRPENNGHLPNLNTDSITNTINHCITDSRKRFHEDNVHQFRETRCVHCNRLFSTQTELNRHRCTFQTENPNLINKCNLCSFATKRLPDLRRHMRLKHTDERPFGCQYCNKMFKLKHHVTNHEVRCRADSLGALNHRGSKNGDQPGSVNLPSMLRSDIIDNSNLQLHKN